MNAQQIVADLKAMEGLSDGEVAKAIMIAEKKGWRRLTNVREYAGSELNFGRRPSWVDDRLWKCEVDRWMKAGNSLEDAEDLAADIFEEARERGEI